MTKAERLAAVFAIAFAIIYAPTMDFNWTLATYHPLKGIWLDAGNDGAGLATAAVADAVEATFQLV